MRLPKIKYIVAIIFLTTVTLGISPIKQAYAEELTADEIILKLKQKPKTRSLSTQQTSPEDQSFINNIKTKTRGLTIEERTELNEIVDRQKMPAINLEVNFALNSATLDPTAVQILKQLGTALSSNELSGANFMIAGHTDARGSKDYNQKLSEERALSVRTFLQNNFNLQTSSLIIVGYGQEQLKIRTDPYADGNRRVQIVNLGKN